MANREFQHKVVKKVDTDILYNELASRGVILNFDIGVKVQRMDAAHMEKYHMLQQGVFSQWAPVATMELAQGGALKMYEVETGDTVNRGFLCRLTMIHPNFLTNPPADMKDTSKPAKNLMEGLKFHAQPVPQNLGQDEKPKPKLII